MSELEPPNAYAIFRSAIEAGQWDRALGTIEQYPDSPFGEAGLLRELAEAYSTDTASEEAQAVMGRIAERADTIWEFFEKNEHGYPFPRKMMKYAANLVVAQGKSPASVDRARKYFETCNLFDHWLFRCEAEQGLAAVVHGDPALEIRQGVFQAVKGVYDSVVAGETPLYDDRGIELHSYTRLDNILLILAEAARLSEDPALIEECEAIIMSEQVRSMLAGDSQFSEPEDLERAVSAVRTYFLGILKPPDENT